MWYRLSPDVSCKKCVPTFVGTHNCQLKSILNMRKINLKRIAELMNSKCGTNVDYSEWPEELSLTGDEFGGIVIE